ncbi:3-keto-disaccharide hydrolase [Tautonia plasticadhaerens]|uniref:3-keto-alpha-glucoside-1,2-lyase/3-keto-2-hydroxy-glucal hydratase domain-containing protein n=1 Tax=Tautonia plasticadhaerens TaxID=2527974 RepID=A0A518HDQ6_9BACT|nr:DUF1080 domain-containing protein [Tautonia plasticadhaerens]QDV38826.1 hypothetical protein ElP_67830 [Tautonia plasticadhaerens]
MTWNRPRSPIAPALLLLLLTTAVPTDPARGGDDDATAPPPAPLVLFDGKALDGWEPTDFYKPGEVAVEDGAIVLGLSPASGGMTGITSTRTDLPRTDYELSYRAKRVSGRDFFAAATFPVGETYLTLVNGGWGGTVTGLSSIDGADASENLTGTFREYENGTWYAFKVRVTDASIRCWVDDEQIVTFDPRGHHLGTRLETSFNQPLGFATWETSGAIKEIVIRPLSPEEVAAETQAAESP